MPRRGRSVTAPAPTKLRPFDPRDFPTQEWNKKRDGERHIPFDLFHAKRDTDELVDEMVVPTYRKHDPKFNLFPKKLTRRQREAAARKLLLMKEFGREYGPHTVTKVQSMLETKQNYANSPSAMVDPMSHSYASPIQTIKSGFTQRMKYQESFQQRLASAARRRKKRREQELMRRPFIPGSSSNAAPTSHADTQQQMHTAYGQTNTVFRQHNSFPVSQTHPPPNSVWRNTRDAQPPDYSRRQKSDGLGLSLDIPEPVQSIHVHDNLVPAKTPVSPKQALARTLRYGLSPPSTENETPAVFVSNDFRQPVRPTWIAVRLPKNLTLGGGFVRRPDDAAPEFVQKKGKSKEQLIALRHPKSKRALRKWNVVTPVAGYHS